MTMPDDTNQPANASHPEMSGSVAEHDEDTHKVDPAFGSAFDDAGSKTDTGRQTTDGGPEKKDKGKPSGDKTGDNKPADDKPAGATAPAGDKPADDKPAGDKSAGDQPAKEQTAAERLEARAAEMEVGGQTDAGSAGSPQAGQQTTDAGSGKAAAGSQIPDATKAGQAGSPPAALKIVMGDLAKVPGLMESKIGVDGKEVALKDFLTEYPEVGQSAVLIGQVMAQQAVQNLIQSGQVVTSDALEKMNAAMAKMEYWQGVQEAHPDGRKIAASPEFITWFKKQSEMVRTMGGSWDKQNGIMILDAYKEHLAKAAKEVKTGQETDKKTKRDDLHKETLRGRQGADTTGGDKGKDDFGAGFTEGGKG